MQGAQKRECVYTFPFWFMPSDSKARRHYAEANFFVHTGISPVQLQKAWRTPTAYRLASLVFTPAVLPVMTLTPP